MPASACEDGTTVIREKESNGARPCRILPICSSVNRVFFMAPSSLRAPFCRASAGRKNARHVRPIFRLDVECKLSVVQRGHRVQRCCHASTARRSRQVPMRPILHQGHGFWADSPSRMAARVTTDAPCWLEAALDMTEPPGRITLHWSATVILAKKRLETVGRHLPVTREVSGLRAASSMCAVACRSLAAGYALTEYSPRQATRSRSVSA